MESTATSVTKTVSRKSSNKNKNETEVVASAPAEIVTTTTEKKKTSRSKKIVVEAADEAAAVIEVKSDEEVETPSPTESTSVSTPTESSLATEILERVTNLVQVTEQLGKDMKNMKEFNMETAKALYVNFDKIMKNTNGFQTYTTNIILKRIVTDEKKSNKGKKKAEKTPSDPSTHAINTLRNTLPFVLEAMGKSEGEQVSRNEVQKFINNMIKAGKDTEYQVKIDGEIQKSVFYINKGELGEFFGNIEKEVKRRGFTQEKIDMGYFDEEGNLPECIQYKMLMGYVSFCFPPPAASA